MTTDRYVAAPSGHPRTWIVWDRAFGQSVISGGSRFEGSAFRCMLEASRRNRGVPTSDPIFELTPFDERDGFEGEEH